MWTAGETLGAAAGPALYAAVLALSSFVSSPADERVAQPGSAITGVLVGITAVPVALLAISLPLLIRFVRSGRRDAAVPV